ncbi:hypothetical protein ETD86_35265 [Nonomuraea turkmeniaca]|uniref:Uncharacterized protein n=1 Tax=Nonomuraea turkmeniaca TaxID=103838 RepID=A0A5S4F636_9ACTN|nr:hypothetical protein [Nonomuraea turkmeniaca]TMR11615.1 hypothetical protein ETD86_35265 [Nonomuraea turkmeniaca]
MSDPVSATLNLPPPSEPVEPMCAWSQPGPLLPRVSGICAVGAFCLSLYALNVEPVHELVGSATAVVFHNDPNRSWPVAIEVRGSRWGPMDGHLYSSDFRAVVGNPSIVATLVVTALPLLVLLGSGIACLAWARSASKVAFLAGSAALWGSIACAVPGRWSGLSIYDAPAVLWLGSASLLAAVAASALPWVWLWRTNPPSRPAVRPLRRPAAAVVVVLVLSVWLLLRPSTGLGVVTGGLALGCIVVVPLLAILVPTYPLARPLVAGWLLLPGTALVADTLSLLLMLFARPGAGSPFPDGTWSLRPPLLGIGAGLCVVIALLMIVRRNRGVGAHGRVHGAVR